MRKRTKFAAGAGATYTAIRDEESGRYVGGLQLEFQTVSREAISGLPLVAEFTPDPQGILRVMRAPVPLHCDRENFGGWSKDCVKFGHVGVIVRYPLWHRLGRDVRVCNHRMELWNSTGRFVDSREWVRVYVYLLSRRLAPSDLRDLFRQWARFLAWPRYEVVEVPKGK